MKKIHTHEDLMKHHEDNCGKCKVVINKGRYEVTCDKCIGKEYDKKKEIRKDIIDEIDANGNGRITKKEIKDFLDKDDK